MAKMYHDVEVVERTEMTPVGKINKVYRVSAYTNKDAYFTLTVPEKQFNKENVDKLLTDRATELNDIMSL